MRNALRLIVTISLIDCRFYAVQSTYLLDVNDAMLFFVV